MVAVTLLVTAMAVSCIAQVGGGLLPASLAGRVDGYQALWPQKWSFFTHLDGETPVAYELGPGQRLVPLYGHRVWDERRVGLSRADDAREVETRRVALEVPDPYWQVCGAVTAGSCAHGIRPDLVYAMDNPVPRPRLCGRVGVAVERVATPAPRAVPDGPRQVYRIAVLEVRCPR